MKDDYVSLAAAARIVGRDRKTLRRWLETGKLKGRVGADGAWRISRISLAKAAPTLYVEDDGVGLVVQRRPPPRDIFLLIPTDFPDDRLDDLLDAMRGVLGIQPTVRGRKR